MFLVKRQYVLIGVVIAFTAGAVIMSRTPVQHEEKQTKQTTIRETEVPKEVGNADEETLFADVLDLDGKVLTKTIKLETKKKQYEKALVQAEESKEKAKKFREDEANGYKEIPWYDLFGRWDRFAFRRDALARLDSEAAEDRERAEKREREVAKIEEELQGLKEELSGKKARLSIMRSVSHDISEDDWFEIRGMQERVANRLVDYRPEGQLPPFIPPLRDGEITSPFGYRVHPIRGEVIFHSGVDIGADYGEPVYASNHGIVVLSEWYGGFGNAVILAHGDGLYTLYGHNEELLVKEGDRVQQGQVIARAGSTGLSTGPHVHFSMWIDNELVDGAPYIFGR